MIETVLPAIADAYRPLGVKQVTVQHDGAPLHVGKHSEVLIGRCTLNCERGGSRSLAQPPLQSDDTVTQMRIVDYIQNIIQPTVSRSNIDASWARLNLRSRLNLPALLFTAKLPISSLSLSWLRHPLKDLSRADPVVTFLAIGQDAQPERSQTSARSA